MFGASSPASDDGWATFMSKPGTHKTIAPFRVGATPVTWGIWKEYRQSFFVSGKRSTLPDDPGWGYPDDHPVVNVSWEDIMNPGGFCEWASDVAGFNLTLPTDAQFEYAARGGKDGLNYPWGNDFDMEKLWCSIFLDAGKTAAVDRSNRIYRNDYGLTDMIGNVQQWCADYGNDADRDYSLVRGGSWNKSNPLSFRCAYRYLNYPDKRNITIGFRLSTGAK